jgi:hypothetical protein
MSPKIGDMLPMPLAQLELDMKNPRLSLAQREEKLDQKQLLQAMLDEFQLDELAASFLHSGFFKHEPVVAIPAKSPGRYVVVEGNRRIAALKLLTQGPSALGISSRSFSEMHEEYLRQSEERQHELAHPWVSIVLKRQDVAAYIGFRHVTGIKQWAALEKAGYIASLIEDGVAPAEIAPMIGSKPVYVSRHYQAYRLIMQAREEDVVDTSAVEAQFGVFMRAMQTSGVREFIKIPPPQGRKLEDKPLVAAARKPFSEFVTWAFGTEEVQPLFTDSRRLTDFGKILQSPKALEYIRSVREPDFEKAHYLSGGEDAAAADSAQVAEFALRDTVPYSRRMKANTGFVDSVRNCADYMAQILMHYPKIRSEYFGAEDAE